MRKIVFILFSCVWSSALWAVVATPEVFVVKQTDGTQLQVQLHGDELFNYLTTADGYVVAKHDSVYEYAEYDENNAIRFFGCKAHNVAERGKKEVCFLANRPKGLPQKTIERLRINKRSLPSEKTVTRSTPKGSPHSLVILVNFTDVKFVTPNAQQAFSDMMNESGYSANGGTGSVRDYFIASSDSAFTPIFDVFGPYDLSKDQVFYGQNTASSSSLNASLMISEACNMAYADGVDFSLYDTDKDGYLDNVFVYYAGHNEAEGGGENTIWPHRSAILSGASYGGVKLYDYACSSELKSSSGKTMCGIGTFCHEYSHVLGLPDFYDTESGIYTVGDWDIMASGNYNNASRTPPTYSSFERFSMGWLTPEQLENPGNYVLEPLETANRAYLVAAKSHNLSNINPTPNEYFLVENRQHVGWDEPFGAVPGVGMLVWHINYDMSAWNSNRVNVNSNNLRMDIVEAYSTKPTSSSGSDTYPGTKNVTICQLKLHDGTDLEMPLLNISKVGNDVSFIFKNDSANSFSFFPAKLAQFNATYDKNNYKNKVVDWEVQEVRVCAQHLSPDESVKLFTKNGFQISFDSLNWKTSLTDTVCADSTYNRRLFVRYYPSSENCTAVSGTLTVQSTSSVNLLALTGISPRPVYVTTPILKETSDITPYSFFVNWEPVDDAEEYYVTVYQITDGNTKFEESFENFNDKSKMLELGWNSNFNSTTTSTKKLGARSLFFTNSGDTLTSPKYALPITSLNFWLCGAYMADLSSVIIGGTLMLYANNGEQWLLIDSISADRTTEKTYEYKFDYAKNYTQFCLKYKHLGGTGGLALDAYVATCSKNVNYIYKNRELSLVGNAESQAYVKGLQPNTEYFVQIQCTDLDKGCEEHLTPLSEPMRVTTISGEPLDSKQLTVAYENGRYVVYVPNADVNSQIYIFSTDGVVQAVVPIVDETNDRIELPELHQNGVYILKYVANNKLKRKGQQWAKFLYQKF